MGLYAVKKFAEAILLFFQFALIVRAILSWFPGKINGGFINLLYAVTEPVIMPARKLLEKNRFVQSLPFDIPMLATLVALSLLHRLVQILC